MLTEFNINTPYPPDPFENIYSHIRDIKERFGERFALDHYIGSSTDTTSAEADGYHKQLTLYGLDASPNAISDSSILFCKMISDIPELCCRKSDGVYQLTKNGNKNIGNSYNVMQTFTNYMKMVKCFNDLFIAIDYTGIFTSTDGETWTLRQSVNLLNPIGMQFNGTYYLIVGTRFITDTTYYYSYTSTDGITWTEKQHSSSGNYFKGLFLIGTDFATLSLGYINKSSDGGTTWVRGQYLHSSYSPNAFVYGNGKYVGVGYSTWISYDGSIWTKIDPNPLPVANLKLSFGAGVFIASNQGKIYRSTDGESWTEVYTAVFPVDQGVLIRDIIFDGVQFIAVTDGMQFFTSFDGLTWVKQLQLSSAKADVIESICYNDFKYIFTIYIQTSSSHKIGKLSIKVE
jgi:hypothetical protein